MTQGLLTDAAPLVFAALGALVSDFSGALGIFIEGFMVSGAFFSWVFALWTGSAAAGVFLSAALAALGGWALALFTRKTAANPFIAALAFNIAAEGAAGALSAAWFGSGGALRNAAVSAAPAVNIPLVKDIPFIGGAVSGQSPFAYLALASAALTALALQGTAWGLRLRASGLSGEAAAERGGRPERYKESAWAAAAFLAALGGAAITFRVGAYTPGGVAGRGWIALAAVYLGSLWRRLSPSARTAGAVLAALVFTLAARAGFLLQALTPLPPTALAGLAPLLALALYTLSLLIRKR
ncbi:MAG: ABC transporter permease [Treponematales bacterium]